MTTVDPTAPGSKWGARFSKAYETLHTDVGDLAALYLKEGVDPNMAIKHAWDIVLKRRKEQADRTRQEAGEPTNIIPMTTRKDTE